MPELESLQESNYFSTLELGAFGEGIALQFLEKQGMALVAKNWRCRLGEIDLVLWDGDSLVFVEVKTRFNSSYARKHLLDNVGYTKKKKLGLLVEVYLKKHFRRVPRPRVRIDVVGVLVDRESGVVADLKHLRGAVGR